MRRGERHGIQKGEQLARSILKGLLRTRFGDVPAPLQQRLAAASPAALQRWSLRVVTAARIDDVFTDDR